MSDLQHYPKIAVLGAGSWGTALAMHTALEFPTMLWSHDEAHAKTMIEERANHHYLPNIAFPPLLQASSSFEETVHDADLILLAIPSTAFTETLKRLQALYLDSLPPVLCATKGIDHDTNGFLSDTFAHHFPNAEYAVLSGPSFAKEVALKHPTAIAIASDSEATIDFFIPYFHHNTLRVYGNSDIKGVQLAGAYKNVIAIATGISDGLGFGANARAALITRGLAEMSRLGVALGGDLITFMGLAGMGDLVLTATDNQSRNRRFGLLLGEGITAEEAFIKIGQVVEGTNIVKNIYALGKEHGIDLPIVNQVYNILHKNVLPMTSLKELLAREQKSE